MVDDLTKVQETIALGKRAQGISRQNIVFSVLVLAVLIPGTLIGILKILLLWSLTKDPNCRRSETVSVFAKDSNTRRIS
jgi:hypothetical protein